MTPKEVVQYLEETLTNKEIKEAAITCPNCKNVGYKDGQVCDICKGHRFIQPRKYINKHKEMN